MADVEAEGLAFWAWDQYWQDGRLASCGGEGGAAYQAAITESWRGFFRTLPDGCRILDVCTGNGAIAFVARDSALERGICFGIEAFDAAVIHASDPEEMIHFSSRVRARSLPYPDDGFDAVISQYGFEYTDIDRSLPELARVSTPGCRLRFMTHAAEGVVVGQARRQLEEAEQLLGSGLFSAARELAKLQGSGAVEQTQALKDRYNDSVRQLEQFAAGSVEPEIYSNTCRVLTHALSIQQQVGAKPVLDKIEEVSGTVRAHAERLNAMTRAALDESGAKALAERMRELWRQEVRVNPGCRADGDLLGWIIASV